MIFWFRLTKNPNHWLRKVWFVFKVNLQVNISPSIVFAKNEVFPDRCSSICGSNALSLG